MPVRSDEGAGAVDTGLHFIDHQQGAVVFTQPLGLLPVFVRRNLREAGPLFKNRWGLIFINFSLWQGRIIVSA